MTGDSKDHEEIVGDILGAHNTAEFIIDGGSDDAEAIQSGGVKKFSANIDASNLEPRDGPGVGVVQDEFEAEFSFGIGSQTVVCPDCGETNNLPESPWLSVFTDEPVPCVSCGYPLL